MGDYGKLMARIWSDKDFTALDAREQQVFMLLLSYPTRNYAGVLPLTLRRWSNATADATPDTVKQALNRLAETHFVVVDWDTEEVLVRSFIRNDEVYRQPNLMKSCIKDVLRVESQFLKSAMATELLRLPDHKNDEYTKAIAKSLVETPSEGFQEGFREPIAEGCVVGGKDSSNQPPSPSTNTDNPPTVVGAAELALIEPAKVPAKATGRRKPRIAITEDWRPSQDEVARSKERYGEVVDLAKELRKFVSFHLAKDNRMADWDQAWRTWCEKFDEYGTAGPGGRRLQGADKKASEWQEHMDVE